MKRCIEFWVKVMKMEEERLMKVVMLEALEMGVKVKWVQNLEEVLEVDGKRIEVVDRRSLSTLIVWCRSRWGAS